MTNGTTLLDRRADARDDLFFDGPGVGTAAGRSLRSADAALGFRLLGPLEVAGAAGAIPVAGGKSKALLALLLLNADRVVAVDRIVDELWGEDVPGTAPKMVQIFVSQLRKQLPEGAADARARLRARVAGQRLDLRRFEQLSTAAGAHSGAGAPRRPPPTARGSARALARPGAGGVRGAVRAVRVRPARGAPRRVRRGAPRRRARARRHHELSPKLESLVRRHPQRERLRGQQMLALYRSGRQAEALASYQDFRRVLDEELGIDPPPGSGARAAHPAAGAVADARGGGARRPARRARPRPSRHSPSNRGTPHRPRPRARSPRAAAREAHAGRRRIVVRHAARPGSARRRSSTAFVAAPEAADAARRAGPVRRASRRRRALPAGARGARAAVPTAAAASGRRAARPAGADVARADAVAVGDAELEAIQRRLTGATPERMLREMLEALEAIAAEAPLVLVLEDLHWSDTSTIELLDALARRREPARLLVVGTSAAATRSPRGHPVHRLGAEPPHPRLCPRSRSAHSPEEALDEYVAPASARRAPARRTRARLLRERTGGNPLFAEDAARLVGRAGPARRRRRGSLARLAADVPDSVRDLIEQSCSSSSTRHDQALLDAASVVGRRVLGGARRGGGSAATRRRSRRARRARSRGAVPRRARGDERWPDGTVASAVRVRARPAPGGALRPAAGRPPRRGCTLLSAPGWSAPTARAPARSRPSSPTTSCAAATPRAPSSRCGSRPSRRSSGSRTGEALEHVTTGPAPARARRRRARSAGPHEFALQSMLGAALDRHRGWSDAGRRGRRSCAARDARRAARARRASSAGRCSGSARSTRCAASTSAPSAPAERDARPAPADRSTAAS